MTVFRLADDQRDVVVVIMRSCVRGNIWSACLLNIAVHGSTFSGSLDR